MFLRKRAASLLRNKFFKVVNLLKKIQPQSMKRSMLKKSISAAETFSKPDSVSFLELTDYRTIEMIILHQINLCYCHECS